MTLADFNAIARTFDFTQTYLTKEPFPTRV